MPFGFGHLQIHQVRDGTVALDGGAMFGVVPRPLWERHFAPDARNRITLALRCMLVLDGTRRILVDDGIGTRWDGQHRDLYGISHEGLGLDAELAKAGVSREEITDVVLTHLHFDHAGGTTRDEGGQLRLSFPRATYHLQRRHWNWAHHASEKDRGSFRPDDFALHRRRGLGCLVQILVRLRPGRVAFERFFRFGQSRVEVPGLDQLFNFAASQRNAAASQAEKARLAARTHDLRLAQQLASAQKFRLFRHQRSEERNDQSVVAQFEGTQRFEVGVAPGYGEVFFSLHDGR